MKRIKAGHVLLILVVILNGGFASFNCRNKPVKKNPTVKICSWNIRDLGQSKNKQEIEFIASTVNGFDIVAIQEVVAGPEGAKAVARLHDELNRKGFKWDYSISDPTVSSSSKSERYAFLWKTLNVYKMGNSWLEQKYKVEIDREPFYATFSVSGKKITVASFHAITKSQQPETEIKYFRYLPGDYPSLNLVFCGDFNLPQSHSVFTPLRNMGYESVFRDQKTSLRQTCINGDCLASEFDNFFYPKGKMSVLSSGIVHFYKSFPVYKDARLISDHVPIFAEYSLN